MRRIKFHNSFPFIKQAQEDHSSVKNVSDLVERLKVVCGTLGKALDTREASTRYRALYLSNQDTQHSGQVNEDWVLLLNMFKSHLATIENHIAKLEEDSEFDKTPQPLTPAISESVETYASNLNNLTRLLWDNSPPKFSLIRTKFIDNKGTIAEQTRNIHVAFQEYTAALHRFVADMADKVLFESLQSHEEATRTYPDGPSVSNAHRKQHNAWLQEARKRTLNTIRDWVDDKNTTQRIFCLLDVAGSGKSIVAKHMEEVWKQEGRLVARISLSQGMVETVSMDSFCSITADVFAALDDKYKHEVDLLRTTGEWEVVLSEEQFELLVASPLRKLNRPAILIIGDLNEFVREHQSRTQPLDSLRYLQSSTPLLRIFLTGLPEWGIKHWAETVGVVYTNFSQLEGNNNNDIEVYIKCTLQDLPDVHDRTYAIIRHAEDPFLWARITCHLLMETDNTQALLDTLERDVSLDHLYTTALEQLMPKDPAENRAMKMVLQVILTTRRPLSIEEMEKLWPMGDIMEKTVARLGSLLLCQDRQDPIRLLHTTFREFLIAPKGDSAPFVQLKLGHYALASGCLNILNDWAKPDNSNLQDADAIPQRKDIWFWQETY